MNVLKRIVLPYSIKNIRVEQVFITTELDLYLLTNNFREKEYELLLIDLDKPAGFTEFENQTFSLKSLFKYSHGEVDNLPVLDLCVRSSSNKVKTSQNKKLFAFILHF
jgi:hypothetical protein